MTRTGGFGRGRRILVGLVAAGAAFGIASAVRADIPDGGVIHACYQQHGGALRVIDTSLGQTCHSGPVHELPLDWNQSGASGGRGPTGPTGPAGVSGVQRVFGNVATISTGGTVSATSVATCPSGTRVVGGGYGASFLDSRAVYDVVNNGPIPGESWMVTATLTAASAPGGTYTFSASALCVSVPS
jgi:hypothetical protein